MRRRLQRHRERVRSGHLGRPDAGVLGGAGSEGLHGGHARDALHAWRGPRGECVDGDDVRPRARRGSCRSGVGGDTTTHRCRARHAPRLGRGRAREVVPTGASSRIGALIRRAPGSSGRARSLRSRRRATRRASHCDHASSVSPATTRFARLAPQAGQSMLLPTVPSSALARGWSSPSPHEAPPKLFSSRFVDPVAPSPEPPKCGDEGELR